MNDSPLQFEDYENMIDSPIYVIPFRKKTLGFNKESLNIAKTKKIIVSNKDAILS